LRFARSIAVHGPAIKDSSVEEHLKNDVGRMSLD